MQLDQPVENSASFNRKSLFFVALSGGAFFGASEAWSLTAGAAVSGWNLSFWPVPALWGGGAAVGALAVKHIARDRLPLWGVFGLELLLMLLPGEWIRSAGAALLAGGFLASLPAGPAGAPLRAACGAGFAVGFAADLFCFRGGHVPGLLLLPPFLLAVVWALPLRGPQRILPVLLLPVAVFLFAPIYSARSYLSGPQRRSEVSIAPALPASLMPAEGEGMSFLFVSDLHSPLPAVWAALPYVSSVDCIWPRAAACFGDASLKVNSYEGRPGRVLPTLTARYDLIYLENLPPVSAASLAAFVEAALERLDPKRGVLVLPAAFRTLLPGGMHVAELPGSGGHFLAASRDAGLTADIGVLDRRLQGYQRTFNEDNLFMPPGIFAALYAAAEEGRSGIQRGVNSRTVSSPPENGFRLSAGIARPLPGILPVAWLLLRIFCCRSGEGRARVLLTENGAFFALVLLAVWQWFDRRELFTGIPALLLCAATGFLLFDSVLRHRAERCFVGAAALLPFSLLLPWRIFLFEPGYPVAVICAALAAGMVRSRISARPELRSASPESVFWSGAGMLAGALLFCGLGILLPGIPAAALIAALLLRICGIFL